MNELGRLPVVGDEVLIDGGTLRVERLDGRRIDRIRFTPDPDEEPTSPPGDARSRTEAPERGGKADHE
jgi:Mg2+/Co2+ transporter CorC